MAALHQLGSQNKVLRDGTTSDKPGLIYIDQAGEVEICCCSLDVSSLVRILTGQFCSETGLKADGVAAASVLGIRTMSALLMRCRSICSSWNARRKRMIAGLVVVHAAA